jgi:hypothetical protein
MNKLLGAEEAKQRGEERGGKSASRGLTSRKGTSQLVSGCEQARTVDTPSRYAYNYHCKKRKMVSMAKTPDAANAREMQI